MSKIVWDATGERLFETGIDRCVIYKQAADGSYPKGEAWNGITGITESPSGAEAQAMYADNIKYAELYSAEEFGATVESLMYPDTFAECNGETEVKKGVFVSQQNRSAFGLSYRSKIGNDVQAENHGYKIHLIYGAKASPSERAYTTINESPEGITFSHEITTTPVAVEGYKPTARITIDSTQVKAEDLAKLEEALYGTEEKDAYLPLPDAVLAMFSDAA